MSSKQVYLLSGPSGSGKTTTLKQFVSEKRSEGQQLAGILQIVQNDKRYLQFLSTNTIKLLQLNDVGAHPKHHNKQGSDCQHNDISKSIISEETVSVGPFLFSKSVLNDSHNELLNASNCDWIIIDEIGPLEIRKKQGYEPAVSNILKLRKTKQFQNTKFIIVVRPSLKDQIAKTYQLDQNEIGEFNEIFTPPLKRLMKQIVISSVITTLCYILYRKSRK